MSPTNTERSDARTLSIEALITLAGIGTSLGTVALNQILQQELKFNFLSMSFWFVLPAGALIGGMAAASGYYGAARLTQTMPSRLLLLNMVALGASTWILSKWLPYSTVKLSDGTHVADALSFVDYVQQGAEHARLSVGHRGRINALTTGELGSLGYAREALQLLGFMAGGLATYAALDSVEACKSCRRYANSDTLLESVGHGALQEVLDSADVHLPELVGDAKAALGAKRLLGFSLLLYQCPKCKREWFRPAVVYRSGNSQDVTKLRPYKLDGRLGKLLRSGAARSRGKRSA
jgi:hypothetical protein